MIHARFSEDDKKKQASKSESKRYRDHVGNSIKESDSPPETGCRDRQYQDVLPVIPHMGKRHRNAASRMPAYHRGGSEVPRQQFLFRPALTLK